jgi:2-oxoisovalerate dehydrogenase E2 component (dihydrolipoyl transacylase)
MGVFKFRLPDVGEGVAEAEITAWHVKVGDQIEEDQSLVDVMTDKATVDMTSPVAGKVLALHGEVGQFVAVGSTLVELEIEGGAAAEPEPAAPARPIELADETAPAAPARAEPAPAQPVSEPAGQVEKAAPAPVAITTTPKRDALPPLAAPATRRRALELGISLADVVPTGPAGRILPSDLDEYLARKGAPSGGILGDQRKGIHETRIIGLRRKIAEKMEQAKRRIPHFTYVEEIDMTEVEQLRAELNEERGDRPKLTLLPFFLTAIVKLQPEFPQINSRYDDEAGVLQSYDGVDAGIATQTDKGLMVPVVRHAEALDIWGMAAEIGRVTAAARNGSASRDELSGSTITLTSLGTLGGISATPVINAPEVAIIGPNKLVRRPVVQGDEIVVRTMMNLSSSFDHRIVDGYDAASFVQRIKRLLEKPILLFV